MITRQVVPFTPYDASSPKMTVSDSPKTGGGCKIMDGWAAKDEAYRTLVAATALRSSRTER